MTGRWGMTQRLPITTLYLARAPRGHRHPLSTQPDRTRAALPQSPRAVPAAPRALIAAPRQGRQ